jgi:transcriptional regulator with XRE-family HTH domain
LFRSKGAVDETRQWSERIGERIRARRQDRGLTLQVLSAETGLSQAFLSRLERGQVSASVANLLQIAGALALPMHELFADPDGNGAAAMPYAVSRAADAGEARRVPSTGYFWEPLAAARAGGRLEALLLTFPRQAEAETLVAHEGEELCFVLEGHIRFRIGGETVRLGPGDSIHLDSRVPHNAENDGAQPARVLMVTAAPHRGAETFDWWNLPVGATAQRGGAADKQS